MRCWKCGANVVGSTCLACGCLQNTRQKAKTQIGESLRYAYDKFGAEQILTDQVTLRRCLSDLLPDEKKLRGQIVAVMQTGIGQRLFELMRNDGIVDMAAYQSFVRSMSEDCGLSAEQAGTVLGYLLEMIGCDDPSKAKAEPKPSVPPSPPPPIDTAAPRPSGPPPFQANNVVQILTSQRKVLIEDATHGVDGRARGKRGDFYVRSDGVSLHYYHGFGSKNPSEDPDFFIPRQAIVKVNENFFLGTYAFTIVTADGSRYRATTPGPKDDVLNTIDAIRSLIAPF